MLTTVAVLPACRRAHQHLHQLHPPACHREDGLLASLCPGKHLAGECLGFFDTAVLLPSRLFRDLQACGKSCGAPVSICPPQHSNHECLLRMAPCPCIWAPFLSSSSGIGNLKHTPNQDVLPQWSLLPSAFGLKSVNLRQLCCMQFSGSGFFPENTQVG